MGNRFYCSIHQAPMTGSRIGQCGFLIRRSGGGMLVLTAGYSFWKDYGRVIALASLDILRAKVINAAAKAKQNPTAAAPALASVAAHVEATAPVAAPPTTGL